VVAGRDEIHDASSIALWYEVLIVPFDKRPPGKEKWCRVGQPGAPAPLTVIA
jgi:hypothetical protein